ncbi:MAG: hypothetical protein M5R40_06565 [Anaerolineae bacterium]|nr:hypothetical protein [Anaerolineae bacterium]
METIRYATLALAREEVGAGPADDSGDAHLLEALRWVSGRIDRRFGFSFAPAYATRHYDAQGDSIDEFENTLDLDAPLLEVASVTDNGGATWTLDTHFRAAPHGQWHTWALRALPGSGLAWEAAWADDWREAIAVAGVWGYRRGYPEASWVDSRDTLAGGGAVGSTTLTLAGGPAGADAHGRAPRFSPGQLLRLGDEFCAVLATDAEEQTLSVRRAAQGSTAADHPDGTALAVWYPEPDIERAVARWAAYLYKRRGMFEQTQFDGVAAVQFPPDAPQEIERALAAFASEARALSLRAV